MLPSLLRVVLRLGLLAFLHVRSRRSECVDAGSQVLRRRRRCEALTLSKMEGSDTTRNWYRRASGWPGEPFGCRLSTVACLGLVLQAASRTCFAMWSATSTESNWTRTLARPVVLSDCSILSRVSSTSRDGSFVFRVAAWASAIACSSFARSLCSSICFRPGKRSLTAWASESVVAGAVSVAGAASGASAVGLGVLALHHVASSLDVPLISAHSQAQAERGQ